MKPRLTVSPGTPEEDVLDLKEGSNTVGRTRENHITLSHPSLSRAHARFEVGEDGVVLHDIQSKNGTFVDGTRIQSVRLGRGHVIKFGDVTTSYEAGTSSSPSMAPKPALTLNIDADLTRTPMRDILRTAVGSTRAGALAATRAERDRNKLRILLKVSQLLASPTSLDTLLRSVLELASDILDIDRAAILMLSPKTGELEPRVWHSRRAGAPQNGAFSQSIARYVMRTNEAALFSDARVDPRLPDANSLVLQSICTSMCAPLKPHDDVLGVLYVDNQTLPNRFDEEDLEFLSAFASQAAIAIENAMLNARLAEEAVARRSLLRFFPPSVVPTMMGVGGAQVATIEAQASLLFCDISGFTEMSSRMRPVEVIALLNKYFPVMAEIVFLYEGTLEKYIGDALLAAWGVPVGHSDDPVRAVRAALDMQSAAKALSAELGGEQPIGVHIGINTGFVAAGNIGSVDYIQYATIGDATNVASRICGVAGTGEIVMDAITAHHARTAGIEVLSIGERTLRGKAEPIELFRIA